MKYNPLISIITVVLNDESNIENTICSVINQSYQNYEYIVIDGGSSDNTVEIVKKYSKYITIWLSEKDNGIYDAMNKGILKSAGEWINFLNSGDSYLNNEILEKVVWNLNKESTLIYGDIFVINRDNKRRYHRAIEIVNDKSFRHGMRVCHQAIFYNKKIIKLYDSSLKLKAELKQLILISRETDFIPQKVDFPIVNYRIGGLGSKMFELNRREFVMIYKELFGMRNYYINIIFFLYNKFRCILKKAISCYLVK